MTVHTAQRLENPMYLPREDCAALQRPQCRAPASNMSSSSDASASDYATTYTLVHVRPRIMSSDGASGGETGGNTVAMILLPRSV
jgi:hypothetical protein